MPELDSSWEYYVPDPEIAEILGDGIDRREIESLYDIVDKRDYTSGSSGLRFGTGNPTKPPLLRLGKEKVGVGSRELNRKLCPQCGYSFQPSRSTRLYCSPECKAKSQSRKKIKRCTRCGKDYTPTRWGQLTCSRSCASKLRMTSKVGTIEKFRGLYESGMKVTEISSLLSISVPTVKRWRKELGLEARGPRGQVAKAV
jgi:transposase-like protein